MGHGDDVCLSVVNPTPYSLPLPAGSQRCVAEIAKLMRAALRPVVVQVPCLTARVSVSPAACPWRVRSRPCVPSPAVGVPLRTIAIDAAYVVLRKTHSDT